jgi:iron complex transport system ATP-binding protein
MKLEVAGMSFGYTSDDVLSDVTFSAEQGDVVSIIGPNGVGKTTLLKCINRIHQPKGGVVMVDGEDILGMNPNDVAKTVGYVPQRAHVSGSRYSSRYCSDANRIWVSMCQKETSD